MNYELFLIISLVMSFAIIIVNFIIIIGDINLDDRVDLVKNIFSIIFNILVSLCGILISMNSSKIESKLKIQDRTLLRVIKDIIYRYKKSELNSKAIDIMKKLDNISFEEQTLFDFLLEFKQLVRKNLLYRVSMNNYLNLLTLIFFYFNGIIFLLQLFNRTEIDGTSKKIVDLFLGILNQIFSLIFSYIAIICDNVNLLHRICDDLNNPNLSEDDYIEKINESRELILNPIYAIFRIRSDLENEKEMNSSINFIGNPI